jgi:prepilin peptidase CpaA
VLLSADPVGLDRAGLPVVGALAAFLSVAVYKDVRVRRIPNALTASLALAGLALAAFGRGPSSLGAACASLGVGLAIWLPFNLIGLLGAGDVKLFAAASAWLTPLASFRAAVGAAIVGGLLGFAWMLYARGAGFTFVRLGHAMRQPELLRQPMPVAAGRDARVPYGVAMAVALLYEAVRLWRVA